jgi:nucleotide-binding universal stress UspA family protein
MQQLERVLHLMKRFKNILVVCDEASAYEHAFDRVEWLAQANDADVTLVDVIDTEPGELSRLLAALPGRKGAEVEDEIIETHASRLEELAQGLRKKGLRVQTQVLQGTAFIQVIRKVLRDGHDLVIKGAQRSPGQPFFRGPDMHLMRKCPCPVWVLNSAVGPKAGRILAAVHPSEGETEIHARLSRTVMELSTSLARQDGARLDVMHVWQLEEEGTLRHGLAKVPPEDIDALVTKIGETTRAQLDKLVGGFTDFNDLMRVLHIKGIPEDVISEHVEAEGIDTVVMGSVGRSGIAGLFIGNTAETILNRVKCSVLTVKPVDFVSPVTLEEGA